jgi:hypothetical protein
MIVIVRLILMRVSYSAQSATKIPLLTPLAFAFFITRLSKMAFVVRVCMSGGIGVLTHRKSVIVLGGSYRRYTIYRYIWAQTSKIQ